jgi:hypothetical protein
MADWQLHYMTRLEPSMRTTYWSIGAPQWLLLSYPTCGGMVRFGSTSERGLQQKEVVVFVYCSDSLSAHCICLLLNASSRARGVLCHVRFGLYFPGGIRMKSLFGRPYMHMAGKSLVSLSGIFLYCNMVHWKETVSMSPEKGAWLSWLQSLLRSCCGGRLLRIIYDAPPSHWGTAL